MAVGQPTSTMTELSKQAQSRIPAIISLPSQWLKAYEDFVTKNASSVSQIESALRSLTYIIPGDYLSGLSEPVNVPKLQQVAFANLNLPPRPVHLSSPSPQKPCPNMFPTQSTHPPSSSPSTTPTSFAGTFPPLFRPHPEPATQPSTPPAHDSIPTPPSSSKRSSTPSCSAKCSSSAGAGIRRAGVSSWYWKSLKQFAGQSCFG